MANKMATALSEWGTENTCRDGYIIIYTDEWSVITSKEETIETSSSLIEVEDI